MAIMTKLYKLHQASPQWLSNVVGRVYDLVPERYRYGFAFDQKVRQLSSIEHAGRGEIDRIVNERFLALFNHAYLHVPFYRKVFAEHGVQLASVKDIRDVKKLPFLTKEIIRENFEQLIAETHDRKKLKLVSTGGTTGTPLKIYLDHDSDLIEWAYIHHIWKRVGYRPGSSRLVMRGKAFGAMARGVPWQYDSVRKELSVNIFDMSDTNMRLYVQLINRFRPSYIHGYMSAITTLCRFLTDTGMSVNYSIAGVLAASENILPHQVEFVEGTLRTRVFSFYGHTERLVLAAECEGSRMYHVMPDYGYAEIVNGNGDVITGSSTGELVGTGFNSFGMPLIRYKTGDLACWAPDKECSCGRPHALLQGVEGRWRQEVVVSFTGALVSITALNMHSDVLRNVAQFQLYQDTIGEVKVRVVPGTNFSSIDELGILGELQRKTKETIRYTLEKVDSLPPRPNGKYLFVDQKLKIDRF